MNYTYYRRYQPRKARSSFKPFFWLVVFLVFVALVLKACIGVVNSFKNEKRDEAILNIDKGSAKIQEFGREEAESASDSQILLEGDQVTTEDNSWVTLTFYNGTRLRMDENSRLEFAHYEEDGLDEKVELVLSAGRVWLEPKPKEQGDFIVEIQTEVLSAHSLSGQALIVKNPLEEAVYSVDAQVGVDFVDRGTEDVVVEQTILSRGNKAALDSEEQVALLSRENVTLSEPSGDDLSGDPFVLWALGSQPLPEVSETETEEEPESESDLEEDKTVEEEPVEEPVEEPEPEVETLQIRVNSPISPITIQEDAIAIEGSIVKGTAARVTVSWSGDGTEYPLGLFEPGSSSFRYVADVAYGNFASGSNTYTIKAYDSEGQVSNVITVVIVGEF